MFQTGLGARDVLRRETRADHEAVDAVFSAFGLSQPGGYLGFLRAQARCLISLEAVLEARASRLISDWPLRRRTHLIQDDLRDLGAASPLSPPAQTFDSDAATLGALYVLEGSRLGGAVLVRTVYPGAPVRFLSPPATPGLWREFVNLLDDRLTERSERSAAVRAARAVFKQFEIGGRLELEAVA